MPCRHGGGGGGGARPATPARLAGTTDSMIRARRAGGGGGGGAALWARASRTSARLRLLSAVSPGLPTSLLTATAHFGA